MTYNIKAYIKNGLGIIEPLSIKRDWMDKNKETAYKCFPVSSANVIGWGISFPEDISFIWDGEYGNGEDDFFDNHVKILSGEKYIRVNSSNITITFVTGISFQTDEDVSLLVSPIPNQFIDGIQGYSAIFSTSFYKDEIQSVYKILYPNKIITIKANTQIASILPISLTKLNNSTLEIFNFDKIKNNPYNNIEYGKSIAELNKEKKWANFYRNATDHKNNKLGKHEISLLNLKVIDCRDKNV